MTRYTTILLTSILSLSIAASSAAAGGAKVVYDFIARYPTAKVSNTMSASTKIAESAGVARSSIFLHPTDSGDAVAEYEVALPKLESGEKLLLVYSAGVSDGIKNDDAARPFDGVSFELRVNGNKQFAANLRDLGWTDGIADLTSQAGKKVKVAFITRPNKNQNYDWALWGAPQVLCVPKAALSTGVNALGKGIVFVKPSKDAVLTVTPLDKAGKANGQPVTTKLKKGNPVATRFDFLSAGAQSVKVDYSGNAGEVSVYAFSPSLEITAFGPTNSILYEGKQATLRAVVTNIGEGTLNESDAGSVKFGQNAASGAGTPILGDIPLVGIATLSIGALLPGASKTIECKFAPAANAAEVLLGAFAIVDGKSVASASRSASVVSNPTDPGKAATSVQAIQLTDGSVVLQSPKLRMHFLKSSAGFAAWTMSVPKGDGWTQVSSGPFGKLVSGADPNAATQLSLYPGEVKTDADSVSFSLKKQIGASACTFAWTFTLHADQPRVSVSHSVKADQPVDILHFTGPTVYAGDGGFGATKDEGLFPGLEYLLTESSSGTEFVYSPNNLRTVPHPNKVTIPFMAVRNGGTLIMLEWDPLQRWTTATDRPAPMFASPNFVDGQDNHLMGIFAPSVPDYTPENKLIAEKPFTLGAGKSIRLEATITAKTDSATVLDAVDEWVARHGLPEEPKTANRRPQTLNLCDDSFLGSSWDPTAKAWKHTITGPVTFDPMIANYLWARDNHIYDEARSQKIADVVRPAVEKEGASIPVSTSLLAGGVNAAIERSYQQIANLIQSQREDGSWPYMPDKEHEVFGKPGDTSSGWTALRAEQLLEHALITGDPAARDAGIKALKFLDTTTRPEGAQTWELQLHVPDILASAHLVRSYLAGYRLTDDKHYLDRAVYWAKSGLPFVYLWNASDRPIMRYGTIPVLGSTWFDRQPWFGVIVQWCGLEYGYALDKLAEFDKTVPWQQVSRGILNCAIQQQEYTTHEYPDDFGMYPDAYSPIKGKEEYHWDLNPRLIARNTRRDIRTDCEPTTLSVRDRRSRLLTMTLPIQDATMVYRPEWVNIDFKYTIGPTIYAVLSGIYRPESLELNGELIPRVTDLDLVAKGWTYDEEKTMAIMKIKPLAENHLTIDLLTHETHEFGSAKPADPPAAPAETNR